MALLLVNGPILSHWAHSFPCASPQLYPAVAYAVLCPVVPPSPGAMQAHVALIAEQAARQAKLECFPLAEGWKEYEDADTHLKYYWNPDIGGDPVWDRPTQAAPPTREGTPIYN